MNVKVGRCKYVNGKIVYPNDIAGYERIVVMTKGYGKWGYLSPYHLTDHKDRILENVWQFSKVYEKVPYSKQFRSRFDKTVIWEWPSEIHIENGKLTKEYFVWRQAGMNAKDPIRYPVGYNYRHNCKCALDNQTLTPLNYIDSRKQIYLPIYCESVKNHRLFTVLKEKLERGEKLMILEVDGPHQESMSYYREKYNIDDFIENDSIDATKESLRILLNDDKHPFGHGYCLAIALLYDYHDFI